MAYRDELYHHGILGQRWGVRRFQNEDGSLTSAGKSRYGTKKEIKNEYKKNAKIIRQKRNASAQVAFDKYKREKEDRDKVIDVISKKYESLENETRDYYDKRVQSETEKYEEYVEWDQPFSSIEMSELEKEKYENTVKELIRSRDSALQKLREEKSSEITKSLGTSKSMDDIERELDAELTKIAEEYIASMKRAKNEYKNNVNALKK